MLLLWPTRHEQYDINRLENCLHIGACRLLLLLGTLNQYHVNELELAC